MTVCVCVPRCLCLCISMCMCVCTRCRVSVLVHVHERVHVCMCFFLLSLFLSPSDAMTDWDESRKTFFLFHPQHQFPCQKSRKLLAAPHVSSSSSSVLPSVLPNSSSSTRALGEEWKARCVNVSVNPRIFITLRTLLTPLLTLSHSRSSSYIFFYVLDIVLKGH